MLILFSHSLHFTIFLAFLDWIIHFFHLFSRLFFCKGVNLLIMLIFTWMNYWRETKIAMCWIDVVLWLENAFSSIWNKLMCKISEGWHFTAHKNRHQFHSNSQWQILFLRFSSVRCFSLTFVLFTGKTNPWQCFFVDIWQMYLEIHKENKMTVKQTVFSN